MASPIKNLKQLKSGGVMSQKEAGLFSVRLGVVGGSLSVEQLETLASAARKYGRGDVHLTVRQGVEIPYVPFENLEPLREYLQAGGLDFGVCGPRIRTITACPGDWCPNGIIKTQELARTFSARFADRAALPHKFKVGITGCPYGGCVKPQENDLGIMGVVKKQFNDEKCATCGICVRACSVSALAIAEGRLTCDEEACLDCGACIKACPKEAFTQDEVGYALFVGGKMGKRPRMADRLPFVISDEQTLERIVDAVIEWYGDHGQPHERFGASLDRIGTEKLIADLEAFVEA